MNYNHYTVKYVVLIPIVAAIFILITERDIFAVTYLHMEKPLVGAGASYQFNNEKQAGPDINSQSERQEFREWLSAETDGWVYHPAFCEYNMDIKPEWGQRIEENDIQKGSRNAFLQGYSLRTTFLPYKPYSLALFGQKTNIPSLSAFSGVTDRDIESAGGTFTFKNRVMPLSLSYTRRNEDQTGFYSSQDESDTWRLSSAHRMGNSNTQLNATYEERMHVSGGIESDIDSIDSSLVNTYTLEDRKISFRSYLSHRLTNDNLSQKLEDGNTLKTSVFQFNENINWEHRDNLRTNYDLLYSRNTSGAFFNETKNIGAGLNHRLYENLTTNVSGDVFEKNFTGGDENSGSGDLRFNYIRPIPWGFIGANMGFNYRLRNSIFNEDFIPVIEESHILAGFGFVFLDNKFVDIDSIRVTDITGTRVYTKDIDYKVDEINFFVRISRMIGGEIADAEEVLVSYRYLKTTPSYDDSSFAQTYGFNFDLWSTLLFSYQYRHSKQRILSGFHPDEPENDAEHRAEIELLWEFTDTVFSYENTDRTAGNSIEMWRVDEILTFKPAKSLFVRFTGTFGHWRFKKGIDEKQDSYGAGLNIDWMPVTWGKFGLGGSHYTVSGDSTKTEDTAVKAVFEMSYSIWNGSLRYSYLIRKDDIAQETRQINNIMFEVVKVNF